MIKFLLRMAPVFHNITVLISLLMFIGMSISFDSTVRLYDSFAEIHQEYNGPLRFQQIDWDNIKHESIMLRLSSSKNDINDTSRFERQVIRIKMNMTGE